MFWFQVNCMIQGDILIRCFHASTSAILGKHFSQIFHFTFNTDFLRKDVSASFFFASYLCGYWSDCKIMCVAHYRIVFFECTGKKSTKWAQVSASH